MRTCVIAAAVLFACPALAFDREAGVPLHPPEAAGAWSLQSNGQTLCVLDLGRHRTSLGYSVRTRGDCSGALSGQPVAWAPTSDGMKLVGPDGSTVLAFGRWSNSLFVTRIDGPANLQLRRGL